MLAAKAGDRAAFRLLYLATVEEVHGYVRRRVAADDAQEVTAEVFCRAWAAMDRYEPGPTPFVGWLVRIAGNLITSQGRRRQVLRFDGAMPDDLPSAGFEDRVVADLEGAGLRRALASLAPAQRRVLELRFLQEGSVREVAEHLGTTEEAVRSLTYRSLRSLRRAVEEATPGAAEA